MYTLMCTYTHVYVHANTCAHTHTQKSRWLAPETNTHKHVHTHTQTPLPQMSAHIHVQAIFHTCVHPGLWNLSKLLKVCFPGSWENLWCPVFMLSATPVQFSGRHFHASSCDVSPVCVLGSRNAYWQDSPFCCDRLLHHRAHSSNFSSACLHSESSF